MADDLPPVSQDFNEPLPTVDPNSQLVPYRIGSTTPDQPQQVTTGYAARARPPIQPPEGFGGGVGFPSLDRIYQAAFSQLPVDEAVKAVNAATKFTGMRLLNQALAAAKTPEEKNAAYGRYGYMALGQGTGVPEYLKNIAEFSKRNDPTLKEVAGGLYRVSPTGTAQVVVPPKPAAPKLNYKNTTQEVLQETPSGTFNVLRPGVTKPEKTDEDVSETYTIPAVEGSEAEPASKGFLGFGAHPARPAVQAMPERKVTVKRKLLQSDNIPNPGQTKKTDEVVRLTKDGKKAVFDANTRKFLRYAE